MKSKFAVSHSKTSRFKQRGLRSYFEMIEIVVDQSDFHVGAEAAGLSSRNFSRWINAITPECRVPALF